MALTQSAARRWRGVDVNDPVRPIDGWLLAKLQDAALISPLVHRCGSRAGAKRGEASEPIYPVLTRSKTLSAPTNDGKRIRDAALALWRTAAISEPVRLLGVTASNLVEDGTAEQLDLFVSGRGRTQSVAGLQPGVNIERVSVGETVDAIVEKFGRGAIRRAVDDPEKVTISVSKRMDRVRRGTEE